MAVTNNSRNIIMTANGDALTGQVIHASHATFRLGSGGVAGERLRAVDDNGDVIFDYAIEGAVDNAELLLQMRSFRGITLNGGAVTGTWTLTVFKR